MSRTCDLAYSLDCEGDTRKTCLACGLPACGGCSVIAGRYYHWRKRRICFRCLQEHFDNGEEVVLAMLEKIAGYDVRIPDLVQGAKNRDR